MLCKRIVLLFTVDCLMDPEVVMMTDVWCCQGLVEKDREAIPNASAVRKKNDS